MKDIISKYNIEVEHDKCMLLYNTLTNALFPIDYKEYAIIETLLEHLSEFDNRYPDLYKTFKTSGFIISSDFDELAYIKLNNKKAIFSSNTYRITINPTLDCNLKCWYCSVGYAEAKHNKERMTDEMVGYLNRHVEYLIWQQKAQSILLDWFGGEPLMYFDEVMDKISESAKSNAEKQKTELRQQITTNATLLNEERIRKMKEANFTGFQIPIDGNEDKHNLVKHYTDKQGSYRDVIHNINLITDIMPEAFVTVRINYDKQTLKNIREIINDFSEKSKKSISIDFQRVWQIECTDKERALLKEAKEEFKSAGFRSGFWAYSPMKTHACYADCNNYYAINYNGKIFKCTARDYGDDSVVGNLQASGMIKWNYNLISKMYERMGFENERCENCKRLPLCMGPCIQKNHEVRIKKGSLPCSCENVEYSLSSYVIDTAKNRNLI